MDDLISRAAAIGVCDSAIDLWHGQLGEGIVIAVKKKIEELPSAQPERKKGKWINIRHDNIAECSNCGITGRAWMNFCFDCGADMREEDA